MTEETFYKACELAQSRGDSICLGGGEPTLHPKFRQFLGYAITLTDADIRPFIVTNGTNKELSLMLARLARAGIISAELSQDDYHDTSMVDDDVVEAFRRPQNDRHAYDRQSEDLRGIRTVRTIVATGRAKDWGQTGCCCPDIFVNPKGNLYLCGCRTHKAGTLWNPEIPEDFVWGECCKDQPSLVSA